MECSTCGYTNASDARFCAQCGTALPTVCPACHHAVGPNARFCSHCGTALLETAPHHDLSRYVPEALLRKITAARAGGTMRGERRTVTMLFADIEGSTAAAERLDPEEWAEVVNGAFTRLIAPVYRYEGTLARLQGDAILAFFGAPIAHEDDPVRAVRAGLEMLEAIRGYTPDVRRRTSVPIAVRVGINTGLVVVGEVGSDLRVEYTALGDAINVAARMEQTAEPGTVRITADTAGLLGGAFSLSTIGPVEVRGRRGPVTAMRVDGVATAAVEAASTPLVGRDGERAELHALLERLVAGVGGIVTIVGEPGIGKSRLLAAMRHEAEEAFLVAGTSDAAGELAWLEGQGRSFDTGVPYAPFIDLAARWLALADRAGGATYDRILEVVTRARGEPDADMAAYLAQVMGAPLPPEAAAFVASLETPVLHERVTAAIVSYLEAEAVRRPLVIVLDDLHWADALSLGLAERLIAAAERVPIALVLTLRPVRDEPPWRLVETASREAAHRYTSIQLDALDPTAADALLEALLGDRRVPPADRRHLLERADGNPLFVEELAGSVGDAGTSDLPRSLSGLLSARLDRLDDDSRMVAELAAVVGREFEPHAVAALVDDVDVDVDAMLSGLVRHGVLTERRRLPTPLFAFRHALIQEAAYNTVLLRDRRELHGRLARHLEDTGPDLPHEIARHHLESDMPDAAFPWLVEAGVRASRAMSLGEAIRLFSTALDRMPDAADPDEVARLHLGLGEAYSLVPDLDQAAAAYQSLAEFGRATARPPLEVRALNRLGINAAMMAADFDAAHTYLDGARAVAEEAGDELGLAEYHMNACYIAVAQGQIGQAIAHDEETARLGEANGADEIRVAGLVRRALNLVTATEFDRAEEALEEARRAAEGAASGEWLGLLSSQGDALMRQRAGDLAGSLSLMTEAGRTLERYGSYFTQVVQATAGQTALLLGDVETALALLTDALRLAAQAGQTFVVSGASATLCVCQAVCGADQAVARHRERALEALELPVGDYSASTVWADLGFAGIELGAWNQAEADLVLGLEASSSSRFWERPRLLAGAARVALERGEPARAGEMVREAVEYTQARELRLFAPLLSYTAGLVRRFEGNLVGAEAELADADAGAEEMGMRLLACDVAAARTEVATARGLGDEARAHEGRHEALLDAVAAGVTDPALRAGLIARRRRREGVTRR